MNSIRQKINERLDELQEMMESNQHLKDRDAAVDLVNSISKFYTVMREEDRDYLQCCIHAIEEEMEWNI